MIHFYCYTDKKLIVVTDLPVDKVKKKYGYRYEIINSIKDVTHLDVITARVLRSYPGYTIEQLERKKPTPMSDETKKKISDAHKGVPRSEETKQKISQSLKGRSNFVGKSHSEETKEVMAEKKLGNQHTKEYHWVYDPRGQREMRIKNRRDVPPGYSLGRDYYSTEAGLYHFKEIKKTTNLPRETQTNRSAQND
jgi:hypothetical protein